MPQGPSPEEKPPVGIIFDSDMGNTIDDVLALALLYGFDTRRPAEADLVSVSVSKSNLKAAALCEAIGGFYSDHASRRIPERFRRRRMLPVGLSIAGKMPGDTPLLSDVLGRQKEDGTPLYSHGIHKLNDTADCAALIRNAFTARQDDNCVVILTGPATNLAAVLELNGAREWIERKVRYLVAAAGSFPDGPADPHTTTDIAAAKRLFAEWPTPIIAVGQEIGEAILYPASSIERNYNWAPHHPIVDAYGAYKPMPYDATTWAMAAVLYAIRPNDNYFDLSQQGNISILDDGRAKFTPSPEGRHRYLIVNPAQKQCVIDAYIEVASAEPPPRELPGFLKRLIEKQKKEAEEKLKQQAAPTADAKPETPVK